MGFFIKEAELPPAAEPRRGPAPKKAAQVMSDSERGCDYCPLKDTWPRITSPQIPLCGNTTDGDILVMGEGPGEEEDLKGDIFIGKTGTFLRRHIPQRDLERLAFTNAVRCFPGSTKVSPLGDINKIFKRFYEGVLVTAITSKGRELSGTPNHPVLTSRGWIQLGLLKTTDQLICNSVGKEFRIGSNPNHYQKPIPLEEIYNLGLMSGNMSRVIGASANFYGEIPDNDVDIITFQRELRNAWKSSRFQSLDYFPLKVANLAESLSSSSCSIRKACLSLIKSKISRFVSISDAAFFLFFQRMGLIPSCITLGSRSERYFVSLQKQFYSASSSPGSSRDFFDTNSRLINGNYINLRLPLFSLNQNLFIAQESSYSPSLNPCKLFEFFDRESLTVETDQVVELVRSNYKGHIYTLETSGGAYIADNVVVSNCRPPVNRTPTGLEMHCCFQHLEEDVVARDFKAVLLVGGAPLSRFVSPADASITQIHGVRFPIEIAGKVLWGFPIFHPSFVERTGGERSVQFPCFRADIRRFFKEVDKWKKPAVERLDPADVIIANSELEARGVIDRMEGILGVDLETSRLKPYERDATIITGSVSDGKLTVAFPAEHPQDPNSWAIPLLLEVTQRQKWIGHQSQFEFTWLTALARRLGIDWSSADFDDSMALLRLHLHREHPLDLGMACRIILGTNIKHLTRVDPRNIMAFPLEEVLPYNGLDAWGSAGIGHHLIGRVNNEYNYQHLLRASRGFAYMELEGLETDQERAHQLKEKWSQIAIQAEAEAQQIYEAKAFVRERQREFNIGNAEHVGSALVEYGRVELPKTPSGKSYSTDDEVLGPIADKNPLARAVLTYREAKKHESTYIDTVLAVPARYPDGRIHPAYSCGMRTKTLRSSSEDPNIQNWPKRRHKEIRGMIRARPGHVLLACDSGQIQARIFGMASKDAALIQSFIDKIDIHTHWMERALDYYPPYLDRLREQTNNPSEDKLLKEGRNVIKYDFVFASFFGQIARSCAEKTGIPEMLVKELLDEFWQEYPDAYKWIKGRRAEYAETGSVTTLTGRIRYQVQPGNEPIITAIQGGEAELMIGALGDLSEMSIREKDPYLHPRICVHDDLTFEVPDHDDRIEEYIKIIAGEMNRVRFPWQIVPLTMEAQLGVYWDDLAEVAVIEGDYIR